MLIHRSFYSLKSFIDAICVFEILTNRLTHILDVCEVKNYPFNVELVWWSSLLENVSKARWADTQLTNKQMF